MDRLYDFDEAGAPVYKSHTESSVPLGHKIQKLWQETPFLKLTEQAVAADADMAAEDATEQDAAPGELSQAQVMDLKRDMSARLGLASSELEKALDLINTILPYQPNPNEPPPNFPLGQDTLAAAVLTTPLPPASAEAQLRDASLSLAIKTKAIANASSALLTASQDLSRTASRSHADWAQYQQWQRAGWRLEARGADRSAAFTTAFERLSREVVAVVGCDEAPPAIRYPSVVYLEPAKDLAEGENSKPIMPPRAAGRRRLRVALQAEDGSEESYQRPGEDDLLLDGQRELFEEELFALVSMEAQRQFAADEEPLRGSVAEAALSIRLASGQQLHLSMSEDASADPLARSATCRLMHCAFSIRLLVLYAHRREQGHAFLPQSVAAPALLAPVISLISYHLHVLHLRSVLDTVRLHCSAADLAVELTFSPLLEDSVRLFDLLVTSSTPRHKVGGHAMLTIGSTPIQIFFALPATTHIELSHTRLALTSKGQLAEVLCCEVVLAIKKALATSLGQPLELSDGDLVIQTASTPVRVDVSYSLDGGLGICCGGQRWEPTGQKLPAWLQSRSAP